MIKYTAKAIWSMVFAAMMSTFSTSFSNAEESIVRIKTSEKQTNLHLKESYSLESSKLNLAESTFYKSQDGLETVIKKEEETSFSSKFKEGSQSLEFLFGFIRANCGIGPPSPGFNEYSKFDFRFGYMLTGPREYKLATGNEQFLLEVTYSDLHDAYGSYFFGLTPLYRFNFLSENSENYYYAQLGFGFVLTDAYKNNEQTAIGKSWEFTPQLAFGGVISLLSLFQSKSSSGSPSSYENTSLVWEIPLHHVSNGSTAKRNGGTNGIGLSLGLKYNL